MQNNNAFVISLTRIFANPNSPVAIAARGNLPDVRNAVAELVPSVPIEFAGHATAIRNAVEVHGQLVASWQGVCGRCLENVTTDIELDIRELFEATPIEGETYPLGDALDLEPLLREALQLELPLLVLCRPDCKGLCAECGGNLGKATCNCTTEVRDPRWDALSGLFAENDEIAETSSEQSRE